jgi:tetratricopeptide (TPR) repeat protein
MLPKSKSVLPWIRACATALVILVGLLVLAPVINYHPLNAIFSEQLTEASSKRPTSFDDLSVQQLKRAIELAPDNCRADSLLGIALSQRAFSGPSQGASYDSETVSASVAAFQRVFAHCPGSTQEIQSHYILADEYLRINEYQLALGELQKYVAAKPDSTNALVNLPNAYERIATIYEKSGDFSNAFIAMKQSLLQDKDYKNDLARVQLLNHYVISSPTLQATIQPGRPVAFGRYTSAVRTANGKLYMLATARDDPNEMILTQSDNGQDWSVVRVQAVDTNLLGTLAIDGNSDVHVAFALNSNAIVYTNTSEGIDRYTAIDIAKTKAPLFFSPLYAPFVNSLQMVVDSRLRAHIIWDYGTGELAYTTIVKRLASVPVVIATNAAQPDIKVSSTGTVYVAYSNPGAFPDSRTQVWFLQGEDGSWSSPLRLTEPGVWAGAVTLTVGVDGSVHVIYMTGTTADDIKLKQVTRNSQGEWSTPETIAEGPFRPWFTTVKGTSFQGRTAASASVQADGGIVVVWRSPGEGNDTRVLGRKLTNGTWGSIAVLGKIPGQDYLDSYPFHRHL